VCPKIQEDPENVVIILYTIFNLVTSPSKLNALTNPSEVAIAMGKPGLEIGPENCIRTC